jgi:hypothetical protein
MNFKRGIVLISSLVFSLILFLSTAKSINAVTFCSGSHTETWTTWSCVNNKCAAGPSQTGTANCRDGSSFNLPGCAWLLNRNNATCAIINGVCTVSSTGSASRSGCSTVTSSTPTPPPSITCFRCHPGAGFCESYTSSSACATNCNACPAATPAPPPPVPNCTINTTDPITTNIGGALNISGNTTQTNGTITSVSFTSANPARATATSPDATSPYNSQITGVSVGSTTVTLQASMNDNNGAAAGVRCSYVATVNVNPPLGWWQVIGGNAITNGSLNSTIPAACTLPACNPLLDLNGTWNYPGNIIYGIGTNLTKANASSKGWNTNSKYLGKVYDYNYFINLVPSTIVFNSNLPAVIAQANFDSGVAAADGYIWLKAPQNTTINSNILISGNKKVILFVNGDLTINGKINIQNHGQGFLMIIVTGNINVNSAVTGTAASPAIEGIYETDKNFDMGGGVNGIYVRGTIVSYGSVVLNRNVGTVNPSESVEYDPALTILFPRSLVQDTYGWSEVLP